MDKKQKCVIFDVMMILKYARVPAGCVQQQFFLGSFDILLFEMKKPKFLFSLAWLLIV